MNEQHQAALRQVAATLPGLPYQAWHFGDSVAFEGMLRASAALNDPSCAAFARGFVRGWAARRETFRPLDCTAAGQAMVRIAAETGDSAILSTAAALAQYLTGRREIRGVYATWGRSPLCEPYGPQTLSAEDSELLADPGPGVFVDCLHFDPPFFAALGGVTNDERWLQRATCQALGYVELLQQQSTGLFHHFYLERTGHAYVLGWGRGQGWALLGLLDVIEAVPDHAETPRLRRAAAGLVQAMVTRQRPDGHWHAVAGVPESGDESSTAAFMAVGFRRAARLGIVSASTINTAAQSALDATLRSLTPDGNLQGVSAAVWASTLDSHYWHVPRGFVVPWGQGVAALALADVVVNGPLLSTLEDAAL